MLDREYKITASADLLESLLQPLAAFKIANKVGAFVLSSFRRSDQLKSANRNVLPVRNIEGFGNSRQTELLSRLTAFRTSFNVACLRVGDFQSARAV